MGVSLKQAGLSGGIVSRQLSGRTDQQKYAVGLRNCTNAWITRYGTIENRPGTQFDVATKVAANRIRLVPFIFSASASYLLEFGANYIRVLKHGVRVSVVGAAAYSAVTTYAIGDLVTYLGLVYYSRVAGNLNHTPDVSPTQWYVQVGGLLEIPTDIPQAALVDFQYVQLNDIMTITEQLFRPKQLLRYSDTKWAFQDFVQGPGIAAPVITSVVPGFGPSGGLAIPTNLVVTGGLTNGTGLNPDGYIVIAWDASTFSGPLGPGIAGVDFWASGVDPITVSWTASVGADGYAVYKKYHNVGYYGLINIVDAATTSVVDTATFNPTGGAISVAPSVPPGQGPYTYEVTAISASTGIESLASAPVTALAQTAPTDDHPNVINWTTITGASGYNVYRVVGGVPGFIGFTPLTHFNDTNFLPDTSIQPPTQLDLFATSNDYPAVCGYYQQRLCFANTINEPQTVNMSQVGNYGSFGVSTPILDNDAVSFTVAGKQVQPIQSLVDLGKLIIHTASAEYLASGNQAGTITPTAISLVATGSAGSELISPVVLGNTDLFVQQGATRLLDLRYEVQSFSYAGKDLTKFATGLFVGRTIVDMSWQKLPHSIVWCVLDNGQLVGLTYVREDELWAWHLHETTNGTIENVATVLEGSDQVTYVCVRRVINGVVARYIEQFASRACLDTVFYTDAIFADSSLTYDGRNTSGTTVTASLGTGWTPTDTVTLTASSATFALADVGDVFVFQQIDSATGLVTDVVSFTIAAYTSTTVVTGVPQRTVPTWARTTALTTWGIARDTFTGIGHLEGQSLSILSDGNVAANPLDDAYPVIAVSGGAFTLPSPGLVVTAGLPLETTIETLPVENAVGETVANKHITVRETTPIFFNSRGGWYGQDEDHLNAWKQPKTSPMGYPVQPYSGPARIPIRGSPQLTGQIVVKNTDPCPFGFTAVVVSGEVSNG